MERIKSLLIPCILLACVAPAMAATWSGLGGDWKGFTSVWDDPSNWEGSENQYLTDRWSIDPGDVSMYGGTSMPIIADGMDTIGGYVRIRNGAVITQTGGSHQWYNGTGNSNTMYIYNGGQWNISGGSLTVNGTLQLGYNQGSASSNGTEAINISGDGIVSVLPMEYEGIEGMNEFYPYGLMINPAAPGITIADNGQLIVNAARLGSTVDDLIDDGKIVGIGGDLQTATVGDLYVVSVVPEPATLALMGLGVIAAFRRKR